MKNIWKPALAAFALFAFTACDSNQNTTTESETMGTDEMETETDMGMDLEEDTTVVVEDTTVNDGVTDEIQEEQPPIQ